MTAATSSHRPAARPALPHGVRARRVGRRAGSAGFTLLEVLVAVAILGLGLTAILSAQFSAVSSVSHARHMSVAVGLARCKMTEVEEQLLLDGFQELDQHDSGACCEGDTTPNMRCEWSVEKPVFPEPDLGKLDLDTDLDLGGAAEQVAGGDIAGALEGGALDSIVQGGVGGIAAQMMTFVYPELKLFFEANTRRVTVDTIWSEGGRERTLTVVQWVTNGVVPEGSLQAAGGDPSVSAASSAGNPFVNGNPLSGAGSRAGGSGRSGR